MLCSTHDKYEYSAAKLDSCSKLCVLPPLESSSADTELSQVSAFFIEVTRIIFSPFN